MFTQKPLEQSFERLIKNKSFFPYSKGLSILFFRPQLPYYVKRKYFTIYFISQKQGENKIRQKFLKMAFKTIINHF